MTEDALAKLLQEHVFRPVEDDWGDPTGWYQCNCALVVDDETEWSEHVASLIALGFNR